jgi:hypothetical protein
MLLTRIKYIFIIFLYFMYTKTLSQKSSFDLPDDGFYFILFYFLASVRIDEPENERNH